MGTKGILGEHKQTQGGFGQVRDHHENSGLQGQDERPKNVTSFAL